MAYTFEYQYPVGQRDLSSFIKNLVEDPRVEPRFEDFSFDTSLEAMPLVTVATHVESIAEEELVIEGIKRCGYDSLSFNITG